MDAPEALGASNKTKTTTSGWSPELETSGSCKRLRLSFLVLFGPGRRQETVLLSFFFFKENFPLWKWHVFIFRNPATGIYNFCGKEAAAQGPMLTLLY